MDAWSPDPTDTFPLTRPEVGLILRVEKSG